VQRVDAVWWTCSKPANGGVDLTDIVGKIDQLNSRQYSIVCKRDFLSSPQMIGGQQVTAKVALINIGTTAGSFTQQFRPIIFKDPLADSAKVFASYPKGTILTFAGRKEDIPQGWHLCDGHEGTVNLVDRLPMGTANASEVGNATEGALKHSHSFTAGQKTQTEDIPGTRQDPHPGGGIFVSSAGHHHSLSGVTTDESSSLPPVSRVYFIQKIS
jgi:hypothetical protein